MITYALIAVLTVLAIKFYFVRIENSNLETENKNKAEAIVAYEALMYILPFEAEQKQKGVNTDEKVKAILNDIGIIDDGSYGM
jgi:hypothetical protein